MLAALAGLGRAAVWAWQIGRKLNQLADDWIGEEPRQGLPDGRPGVLARLDSMERGLSMLPFLEERLAQLEAQMRQMRPNGGASLRDAVNRIDTAVAGADPTSPPDQIAA